MLEEFRQQASASFLEDDDLQPEVIVRTRRRLLGMTPVQRFLVAVLLLVITLLLGTLFLLATNHIVLP